MHSVKERPVVVNGQIVIRPIMVVALTYDHRLLDGREGTTFLGMCPISFFFFDRSSDAPIQSNCATTSRILPKCSSLPKPAIF